MYIPYTSVFCLFVFFFTLEKVAARSKGGTLTEAKISRGRETLRLRNKGPATVEEMVRLFCGFSIAQPSSTQFNLPTVLKVTQGGKIHVTNLVGRTMKTVFCKEKCLHKIEG